VGREGAGVDLALVAGELLDALARGRVPEARRLVDARRGEELAVARERERVDRGAVALEPRALFSGLDVEEEDRALRARARERLRVGRKGDVNRLNTHEPAHFPIARRLPELDAVDPRNRKPGAVGQESDPLDLVRALEARLLLPVRGADDDDRAVPAARGDALAVRGERDRRDLAVVALELERLVARRRLPRADAVGAARGEALAVGREGDRRDVAAVTLELVELVAGRVPEAHGRVPARRRERLAVGRPGDGEDLARVAVEVGRLRGLGVLALEELGDVEEPDALVVARRGEELAVGREGDALDVLLEAAAFLEVAELALRLPRARLPEADLAVGAARGEELAPGREGDGVDLVLERVELLLFLPRREVPDADRAVGRARREPQPVGREGDGVDRALVSLEDERLLALL